MLDAELYNASLIVDHNVERGRGDKPAYLTADVTLTYEQLRVRVNQMGHALREVGVRREERVLLVLDDSVTFPVTFLAAMRIGAVPVPVSVRDRPQAFAHYIADSYAGLVVCDKAVLPTLQEALADYDVRFLVHDGQGEGVLDLSALVAGQPSELSVVTTHRDDMAFWLYSSGSTGAPKGVVHRHQDMELTYDAYARQVIGIREDDRIFSTTKLFHGYGLGNSMSFPLHCGACAILLDGVPTPERILGTLREYRPTAYFSVPALYALLSGDADADGALDSVRLCVSAAEPLPDQTFDRWLERFGLEIVDGIGSTELLHIYCSNRPGEVVRGTMGRPVPGYGLRLTDESGIVLDDGPAVGTLEVRGDSCARYYWHRPEETRRCMGGAWFMTGDRCERRADGTYVYVGRVDDMLKVGGLWVSPVDIEQVVREHPGVKDAGVVDVSAGEHSRLVTVVECLSEVEQSAELALALREWCGERLPTHEVPHLVCFVEALPRTPNGKLQRFKLRALAEQQTQELIQQQAHDPAIAQVFEEPSGALADAFSRAPEPEREGIVLEWVKGQVAAALGYPSAAGVQGERSFTQLGLDSLGAVRLRNALAHASGLRLTTAIIFEYPSPQALAAYLASRLIGGAASEHEALDLGEDQLPQITSDLERRFEPFPLNDIQRAYLVGRSGFFELGAVSTHLYLEAELPDLDRDRLNQTLRRLIDRHEMLRVVISDDGTQRVLPSVAPYEVQEVDLSAASATAVQRHLQAVRDELSHEVRPADRWPLFEVRATQLPGGRALVHVSIDLLVVDVTSMRLLFAEAIELYGTPELQPPPFDVAFRDYVLAERSLRGGELYERSRSYWMKRLPELPPAPELPMKGTPETLDRQVFTRREHQLPAPLWEGIKARAAAEGITPSVVVLSAFAQVLGRWGRRSSFLLNVTVSNRLPLHPQVDALIGDFTTVELLEVSLGGQGNLRELAGTLQERLWQDVEHSHFSGVEVLRELARDRGGGVLSAPYVFTSGLGSDFDALRHVTYAISQTPQVLIDHQVYEVSGGLTMSWDSIDELFPDGILDDMFDAYVGYLRAIAQDDGLWDGTSEHEWLPEDQRSTRAQVNATAVKAQDALLHTGFLAQAEQHPDRVAVVSEDGSLTYGELAARAGALAAKLRALGVRPNGLVGVSIAKGWQQVAAVLGVLMAGGAYLPIDAALPDERRQFLVEHGDVDVVVTSRVESERWPGSVKQVQVPEDDAEDDAENNGATTIVVDQPAQTPDDLAYVIYTSGSTGAPKGVTVTHAAAWNTVADINERFAVSPEDRVLGLSSLSFDLSVYDIFGVLAAGGALVLPKPDSTRDPRHWLHLCEAHAVTIWNSVPALMEMALDQAQEGLSSLRLVLLSGDWLAVTLPERVRARAAGAQVVSLGGATEAAIWSILYPVDRVEQGWESIPYGKPLRNQFWEILNDRLQPCPVGVAGDLYIGGKGLAQGYWRDEEKTAASFVVDSRSGARLYRTGDLGRYMRDGNIEFLGREDTQVKVNGYRIELGEIETHLSAHPGVRTAAVAAVGEQRDKRRLVAYVVPDAAADDSEPAERSSQSLGREAERSSNAVQGAESSAGAANIEDPDLAAGADALERLAFKLRRPGLRKLGDAPTVELPSLAGAEERKAIHHSRRSHRAFDVGPVALESLAALLEALRSSVNENGLPKRWYGSAGTLYPVQLYVGTASGQVGGLSAGAHYYDPDAHALRALRGGEWQAAALHASPNAALAERSAFTIVLVAELAAIEPLYGTGARDLALIEAGLMAQLLEMQASDHGIGLCQVAMEDSAGLREALALSDSQVVLHGLVGGQAEHAARPARNGSGSTPGELGRELRDWLQSKLPGYMVPGQFVTVERLPLTSNGKVDRGALARLTPTVRRSGADAGGHGASAPSRASIDGTGTGALAARMASASASERESIALGVVREAVASALGAADGTRIEPDVPFVELGLDSLTAVRLRNLLEAAVGLQLPATVVFDRPTPRLVARHLLDMTDSQDNGGWMSVEEQLAQIGQRLKVMAMGETERPAVVSYLHTLLGTLRADHHDDEDRDLREATGENIFELIDKELGA